jgi:hypothetical protein
LFGNQHSWFWHVIISPSHLGYFIFHLFDGSIHLFSLNSFLLFLYHHRINFYIRYGSFKKSSFRRLIMSFLRFKFFVLSRAGISLIINIQSSHFPLYSFEYNVSFNTHFNHNLFHLSGLSHCFLKSIHLGCSDGIFYIRGHCIIITIEYEWVIFSFVLWDSIQGLIEPDIKISYHFVLPQPNLVEFCEEGIVGNWGGNIIRSIALRSLNERMDLLGNIVYHS